MEIERKYLVKTLPDNIDSYEKREVSQAYISTSPVIRIRRSDDNYYLTIKSKGLLKREEFEIAIKEEEYRKLLPKCDGNIIEKTRYHIPLSDGLMAELDIFHGRFEGLRYVEVEFPSEEDAFSFTAPDFFGKEVTEEAVYQNSSLSSMNKSEIEEFIRN